MVHFEGVLTVKGILALGRFFDVLVSFPVSV